MYKDRPNRKFQKHKSLFLHAQKKGQHAFIPKGQVSVLNRLIKKLCTYAVEE